MASRMKIYLFEAIVSPLARRQRRTDFLVNGGGPEANRFLWSPGIAHSTHADALVLIKPFRWFYVKGGRN